MHSLKKFDAVLRVFTVEQVVKWPFMPEFLSVVYKVCQNDVQALLYT